MYKRTVIETSENSILTIQATAILHESCSWPKANYRGALCFIFCLGALFWISTISSALADFSRLTIPYISYKGGNAEPRPDSLRSLLSQVAKRTSIEVNREPLKIKLQDPALYNYPFLFMAGDSAFQPFSREDVGVLRHYLRFGGFLLIDDSSAKEGSPFDISVRRLISRLFPKSPMQKISRDHSIFRSFYLMNRVVGRVNIHPYLEGISIKGRTVLAYSSNDMGGAWSRDKLGHWHFDVISGGERQRQLSIRLGVNIIMYSLTLDYKKDMVHLPIILERLRRYQSQ